MTNCKHIDEYIKFVRSGQIAVCNEQILLIQFVEQVFETEDLMVDEAQLEKYLSYQKYFPFKLLPWEKFCFALHNCVYRQNMTLRFPNLDIIVGRGSGKNGYLAFENFCLLTDTNGVKNYDIYTFAMSEEQAKTSWQDLYDILEDHKDKMVKHFRWTKEVIVNKDTNSKYVFCTSSAKTKDGQRPRQNGFRRAA
jgi:phage terminase large subunit-like protein